MFVSARAVAQQQLSSAPAKQDTSLCDAQAAEEQAQAARDPKAPRRRRRRGRPVLKLVK